MGMPTQRTPSQPLGFRRGDVPGSAREATPPTDIRYNVRCWGTAGWETGRVPHPAGAKRADTRGRRVEEAGPTAAKVRQTDALP